MVVLKKIGKIFLGSSIALMAALLIILAVFQNSQIKQKTLNFAITKFHSVTGWQMSVGHIEGLLPLQLRAENFKIVSPDKTELFIKKLHLVASPWDLFSGKITLHLADFQDVKISTTPSETSQKKPLLPFFPFYLYVNSLQITQLQINNDTPEFNIWGSLENYPSKRSLKADLVFTVGTGAMQSTAISIEATDKAGEVFANIHVKDPFKGFLYRYLHLKNGFASEFFASISGPRIAWLNILQNQSKHHHEGLKGQIQGCCQPLYKEDKFLFDADFAVTSTHHLNIEKVHMALQPVDLSQHPLITMNGLSIISSSGRIQQGEFAINVEDLSLFKNIPLKGKSCGILTLEGTIFEPNIHLNIITEGLQVQKLKFDDALGKLDFSFTDHGIVGIATANFDLKDNKAKISVPFMWDEEKNMLSLSEASLEGPDSSMHCNLAWHKPTNLLKGKIEVYSADLSAFSSIFQKDIQGILNFNANFEIDALQKNKQVFSIEAQGKDLAFDQFKSEQCVFKSNGALENGKIQTNLTLEASNTLFDHFLFNQITFTTDIDPKIPLWPYDLSFQMTHGTHFSGHSQGNWHQNPEEWFLTIHHFEGALANEPFVLQDAVTFKYDQEKFEFDPIHLTVGQGFLNTTLQNKLLSWKAENLPLDIVNVLRPELLISGFWNSEGTLQNDSSIVKGSIQASFTDISSSDQVLAHLPLLGGSFSGKFESEYLIAEGLLKGIGSKPITFDTKIPCSFSLMPFSFHIDLDRPVSVHGNLNGEIAPLLHVLMDDATSITGNAVGSLTIGGTLRNMLISGQMEIDHGSFESLLTGAVFKEVHAKIQGNGRKIDLIELSAIDSHVGSMTAFGSIDFDPIAGFPFNFSINLNKASLLHLDYASAIVSGHLYYFGKLGEETLSGKLLVDGADVHIPEEIPAKMHHVNVKYINHPKNERLPSYLEKTQKKIRPVNLNVTLTIPKNTKVFGKDLSSEWKGSVIFTGTDESPLINGNLEVIKGKYMFNGKNFDIHNGTITFAGSPANKTTLYVTAEQEIENIKTEVILKGPIKKPMVSFRSNPPMSQKEILSWILFNHGTEDITATQSAQLSQNILTLSGGDATDILGKIRRSFGIDRIDISSKSTTDSNELSLRVGKYIYKGLFLSINKGISAESANQVAIEANITRNIKAQAQVDDNAQSKMILKWQKDY